MGRHQLELAVAFFLLGGDTASAINVCAKTLKDEQLALVICRLLEGYNGPSEHYITSKFLLPSAYENGDYWKSSFLEVITLDITLSFFFFFFLLIKKENLINFMDFFSGYWGITINLI